MYICVYAHVCVCRCFSWAKEEHAENVSVMKLRSTICSLHSPGLSPTILLGLVPWSWAKVLKALHFPSEGEWFLPALRVNLSTWKTDYSLPPIHPMSVWIVSQKGSWLSVISSFTDHCFILAINTSSDLKTLLSTAPQSFRWTPQEAASGRRPQGPLASSDAHSL